MGLCDGDGLADGFGFGFGEDVDDGFGWTPPAGAVDPVVGAGPIAGPLGPSTIEDTAPLSAPISVLSFPSSRSAHAPTPRSFVRSASCALRANDDASS
jgi:hypothetical protein